MRSLFTFILSLFIFSLSGFSQEKESYAYSVTGQAEYGYLISHHAEMHRLSIRYFSSFRLFVGHKTTGKKAWHQEANFPELGVGAFFSPLMFNDQLGQAYAVFGYFDKVYGKKERNNFHFRFGFGPGFLSSKFNSETNNQNIAIGSNVNIFFFIDLQKEFKISKAMDVKLGLGMSHFSNTGIQKPNLGINLASGQIGIKYRIGTQSIDVNTTPVLEYKKWTNEVLLNFGRRQVEVAKAKSTVINARYQTQYSLNFRNRLVGSGDLFLDVSDPIQYEFEKVDNVFQVGITAGYLLNLDQIQFMLEWGFYVYNNSQDNDVFYHRLGCMWIASDHLIVNLSLRTVWASARNVELGLGWRF
jgi:hypothetical protein